MSCKDKVSTGTWAATEALQSSTWRELEAVHRVLHDLREAIEGNIVQWCTDNQNVVRIIETGIETGSKKASLQDVAISIFAFCKKAHIELEMKWIPRTVNEKADFLSRCVDSDDWSIKR